MKVLAALLLALLISACARPYDDGMGDLWKGVACVQKGTC